MSKFFVRTNYFTAHLLSQYLEIPKAIERTKIRERYLQYYYQPFYILFIIIIKNNLDTVN